MDSEAFQDPDNEMGLFAGTVYEADDEEADKIYESVDLAMDQRRKARRLVDLRSLISILFNFVDTCREAREVEEAKALRAQRPKIQTQFADLKRALSVVTDEQWENIPEVGNLTKRRKVRDFGKTYAVPDSVIVGDRERGALENSLDDKQQEYGGFESPADAGGLTDIVSMGHARDKVLSLKLDQVGPYNALQLYLMLI